MPLQMDMNSLPKEILRQIEKKLEMCRNQENNPDSEAYKRKIEEMLEEDDRDQSDKYSREADNYKMMEEEVLNSNCSDMDEE
ncbi:CCNH [Cordylochernes scorpioides]|uniref:CCNH n=1 Tax=Cordylochernes scorpioides TaxID=51811 RepID=A0ABY6LUM5_9ARAC|nr:CCNH [Cordylochernes scorpioides]